MKIVNLDSVEKIKVEMEGAKNAFKQLPISSKDGSPLFSFRVFTVDPDGHTPYHTHSFEHINYVIEGQGFIKNEKGDSIPIKKGDFALILPNEKHQYVNHSSNQSMVMICAVPKEYE